MGIVSSIVGLVVVAGAVFAVGFNGSFVTSHKSTSHSPTTATKKVKDLVTKPLTPDIVALDGLIASVVPLSGWDNSSVVSNISEPTFVDTTCGTQTTTVPVSLMRSQTYVSAASPASTVSVQVEAYPAGLGAVETSYVLNQVSTCSAASVANSDLGYATQSFEVNSTIPNNFDSSVYIRVGDVVGVVTTAGSKIADASTSWASSWYPSWAKFLTTNVCPQQTSTVADSSRSPYSVNYAGGWNKREVVILDKQRKVAADIAGHVLLLGSTIKVSTNTATTSPAPANTVTVLPTVAEKPVLAVPLTGYPASLKITLPTGEPTKPIVPIFPTEPNSLATSSQVVADPVGPGCGWSFTGEAVPINKNNSSAVVAANAEFNTATKLVAARAEWWVDRYNYVIALNTYTAEVAVWNKWVAAANPVIAAALWKQYNSDVIAYQDASIVYAIAYANWEKSCPSPFNASTCANPPVAPVAPTQPAVPNPNP